ncbi:MAG: alpha/beta hydrolase [Ottowia sp.]|nr:alpha/beta hydrolase [Ottowia sp.]
MNSPALHRIDCPDAHGGHRMAWWQWGQPEAEHLIVCAHGLTRQGRDFDVLAQALLLRAEDQGRALRVACLDVAGRGESDWLKDPMDYQFPTYVGDALAMLGALQRVAPIRTFDWLGSSMGGLIGMSVAGLPQLPLPVPVRKLVLNDVGPAVQWAALQRIGRYLGRSGPYATVEQAAQDMRALSAGFGPHTDEEWLALSRPMLRPLAGGGYRMHYDPAIAVPYAAITEAAAAEGEQTLWALYDAITADTLVLRGAESDLLAPATVAAMAQRGPHARSVEFLGVGHAPTLVAANQLKVVLEFLLPAPI